MKSVRINHYLMIFITYSVMLMFGFIENLKGMAIPPIRNEFHVDFAIIGTMVFFFKFRLSNNLFSRRDSLRKVRS